MDTLQTMLTFYLKSVATPHCLAILSDLSKGDYASIVNRKVDPRQYRNPTLYLADAQASAFFSKNASLSHPCLDPRKAALDAWYEAEGRNAVTNALMRRLQHGPVSQEELMLREFLLRVKKRVAKWLGPLPTELDAKFGPGSTLCCPSHVATVADKMTVKPTTTSDAWRYAGFLRDSAWFRSLIERGVIQEDAEGVLSGAEIVRSSRWACVPKNAKTHRSIEIGPSVNIAFQLSVGQLMKQRFRRFGWDLRYAASEHKYLAKVASEDGSWATIDLKQASDSLSKNLVEFLLPTSWYTLLDDLRSKTVEVDGRTVYLNKFSGMGNGYTFELESVIFMSIAQEVCSTMSLCDLPITGVNVFGDDIIVPTAASTLLVKVLKMCGLETNVQKTFVEGPFRESCGGDYFHGWAVRPFYLKENPYEPQHWMVVCNGLYGLAHDHAVDDWLRRTLLNCRTLALRAIPSAIRRCRGPKELGDIVIREDDPGTWSRRWTTKTRNSIRQILAYKPVLRLQSTRFGGSVVGWEEFLPSVKLATILLGQGVARAYKDRETGNRQFVDVGIIPRDPILSYKMGWVKFS